MIVNNLHCDVTLQCQDGAVQVSGLILASFSPLFKQLGKLDWDTDFVMLPDFTVSFFHFFYFPSFTNDLYVKKSHLDLIGTILTKL